MYLDIFRVETSCHIFPDVLTSVTVQGCNTHNPLEMGTESYHFFLITVFTSPSFDSVDCNHFVPLIYLLNLNQTSVYMHLVSLCDVQFNVQQQNLLYMYIYYLGDMFNCIPNFRLLKVTLSLHYSQTVQSFASLIHGRCS